MSFQDFLIARDVPRECLAEIESENLDEAAIQVMDEETLTKFIPKLGDRVAARDFCKRKMAPKKVGLIEKLREKLSNKNTRSQELLDCCKNEVDINVTVEEMYEVTKVNKLRFYLSLVKKEQEDRTCVTTPNPTEDEPTEDEPTENEGDLDLDLEHIEEVVIEEELLADAPPTLLVVHRGEVFEELLAAFQHHTCLNNIQIEMILPNGQKEVAEDMGGVLRDALSEFWQVFYDKCTAGTSLKVPCLRDDFGSNEWEAIAKIIGMGWTEQRYFPILLSPVFIMNTLGIAFNDEDVIKDFLKYISESEAETIKTALENFEEVEVEDLLDFFSNFDTKRLVTKNNLNSVLLGVAHKELLQKPEFISKCFSQTRELEKVTSEPSTSGNIGERQLHKEDNWVLDFGTYLGKIIDDVTKQKLLEKPWSPDLSYKFPSSGPRNLKFQIKWLDEWRWLVHSPSLDSVFCKYCSLFSTVVGQQATKGGKLVKTPFKNWMPENNSEIMKNNKNCIERAANSLNIMMRKSENVILQINKHQNDQIINNRKCLKPIIRTAIYLARLGNSFRGHRDSGPFDINEPPVKGEGNFPSLLKFRIEAGDHILAKHPSTAGANATYISWQIQNEIISAFNSILLKKLVDKEKSMIREDVLQFIPVSDVTSAGLTNSICNAMIEVGLDVKYLVGQGYDGASAMSGALRGAQAIVRESYPKALYVHCSSHCFNLALSDGCSVAEVRNCLGTIGTTYNFFNFPKRQRVTCEHEINKLVEKPKIEKLKRLCPTRWIQRHDAVNAFVSLLKSIISALFEIATWTDKKTASDAQLLSSAICQSSFLLCTFMIKSVFSLTLPLSKYLQTPNLDLSLALDSAENVNKSLKKMRQEDKKSFSDIYQETKTICDEFDITILQPRTTNRQTNRNNVPGSSPEEYYRRAIYVPFLDQTIQAINEEFINHRNTLEPFQRLLCHDNSLDISKIFNSTQQLLETTD
ncbi:unnamed protein product [Phaedon cochleariae]|uniref:Uncharacterized protein n=1 Tax=Phaedon cochleariae TaxID=80249 RepID=A0A9P0DFP5_PHACE|nr:unnamed protein product [Phaedon cochleariae]